MRQPRLEPVKEPREGRDDEEGRDPSADRSAPLDGQHGEGTHGPDADQRRHAGHPEEERGHQASTVAAAEAEQYRQHPGPSEDTPGGQDGLDGLWLGLWLVPRGRRHVSRSRFDGSVMVAALPYLAGHEPPVGAPAPEQLRVSSALDDAPVLEHEDPVGTR